MDKQDEEVPISSTEQLHGGLVISKHTAGAILFKFSWDSVRNVKDAFTHLTPPALPNLCVFLYQLFILDFSAFLHSDSISIC